MPSGSDTQICSLGTLDFDGFSVPEDLAIHRKTLGGSVEIPRTDGQPAQKWSQTLGVVVDAISFEAWFVGPDAEDNARRLEAMQRQQAVLTLQLAAWSFDVVIMELTETLHTMGEIRFALTLEPQVETSTDGAFRVPDASAQLQVTWGSIADYQLPAIATPDSAVLNQLPTIQAAQQAVRTAKAPGLTSLTSMLALASTLTSAAAALKAIMGLKAGSTLASDVALYFYAASLRGQIQSAVATMGTFTGANAQGVVNPAGQNAHQIAVRYTGDAANADAIMQANGLTDPFALGSKPLVIPTGLLAPA